MGRPGPFPGRLLETAGNGGPRQMTVQRQNPAYRSAYLLIFIYRFFKEAPLWLRLILFRAFSERERQR